MREIELKGLEKDYRSDEAYKSLRTNIEFSGENNRALVFTSCTPNEGKSTVSLSVAASLAESGKKVLFIDADLRKSVLAGRHGVQGKLKGLSHFLSGKEKIEDVVCKTQIENMMVILAGIVPPNPAELLGQEKFANLISSGRKVYDYIIIDAPPLGSVIDAAIIAKVCDASVLVISVNTISRKFARTIKKQLERSECPILGVVLNKVDMAQNKYYGKYYGHYGEK